MASCSFDMLYTFVNVGCEGSAHDITVWKDSISNKDLSFPQPLTGKYYLVDSGYPNTIGYLTPYKETRYHQKEFQQGFLPEWIHEHFNLRHSSLRSIIERSFGVLKAR